MIKFAFLSGSLWGMLSVIIGAFGAHKLKSILPPNLMNLLDSFETGVRYQMFHAIILLIIGILGLVLKENAYYKYMVYLFNAGIFLFSVSIYLLVINKAVSAVGLAGFGLLTPIGGVFLILGWFFLIRFIMSKTI